MNNFFENIIRELDNFCVVKSAGLKPEKPSIERQFLNEVRLRKELNSEHVWSSYYIPIACAEIVKAQGTITEKDKFKLECLANSLMFKDMADGKLNEFYQFEK